MSYLTGTENSSVPEILIRDWTQAQRAELEDSLGTASLFDDLLIINHLEFAFLITLCEFQVRRVCELVSDQLQNGHVHVGVSSVMAELPWAGRQVLV